MDNLVIRKLFCYNFIEYQGSNHLTKKNSVAFVKNVDCLYSEPHIICLILLDDYKVLPFHVDKIIFEDD